MCLNKEIIDLDPIQPVIRLKLSELKNGQPAKIAEIPGHDLLAPLGIRIGKRIKVESRQPFEGPLLLCIDGRKIAISRHFAKNIAVEK